MRLIIDTLLALMLAGLLGGIMLYRQQDQLSEERVEQTRQALRQIQQQLAFRAVMADTDLTGRGFPARIEPEWFTHGLPENVLAGSGHPWMEIAGRTQASLLHPPVRVLLDGSYAAFWYNPYQGVVRARVPADVPDDRARQLYFEVNGTSIDAVVDQATLRALAGSPGEFGD